MRKIKNVCLYLLLVSGTYGLLSCDKNSDAFETDKVAVPDSIIIGTWELKTLYYPFDRKVELPLDERDLFLFDSNGKVKVVKKTSSFLSHFPNENGEYDYSYDKGEEVMQFWGKTRKCMISDGEMHLEGYSSSDDGPEILEFIFIKKL